MEKYFFCKDIDAAAPEFASSAYPTAAAAVLNYLLYCHPSVKHMCKLSRRADDKPYQLTTSRPNEKLSMMVCETDVKVSDGEGRAIYGDDQTITKPLVDLTIREIAEAYRLPLIIERH